MQMFSGHFLCLTLLHMYLYKFPFESAIFWEENIPHTSLLKYWMFPSCTCLQIILLSCLAVFWVCPLWVIHLFNIVFPWKHPPSLFLCCLLPYGKVFVGRGQAVNCFLSASVWPWMVLYVWILWLMFLRTFVHFAESRPKSEFPN